MSASHAQGIRAVLKEGAMLFLLIGLLAATLVIAFLVRAAWAFLLPVLLLAILLLWLLLAT